MIATPLASDVSAANLIYMLNFVQDTFLMFPRPTPSPASHRERKQISEIFTSCVNVLITCLPLPVTCLCLPRARGCAKRFLFKRFSRQIVKIQRFIFCHIFQHIRRVPAITFPTLFHRARCFSGEKRFGVH